MPSWFWFIPAGVIVLAALYVLWRHFFRKKGDCCDKGAGCRGCGGDCKNCKR